MGSTTQHRSEPDAPAATPPEDPAAGPAPATAPQPVAPEPLVLARNVQLVLLLIAALGVWSAVRAARNVVLLFVVASLIALILNPLVGFLHRLRVPRGLAVLLVYVSFFAGVVGIGYLLSSPISDQVGSFRHNVPALVDQANKRLAATQRFFDRNGIHIQLVKQGATALQTLGDQLVKGSSSLVAFSGALLTKAASVSLDLVLILVLSVYMLVYGAQIGGLVRTIMPGDGSPQDDYPLRVQRAVSGYVRGQLLFSAVMGATAGLALYLFGVLGIFPDGRTYAFAFGAFFGVMELVPFIGPLLGAVPPIVVALFVNPLTAVWVGLLFLALQQLEGHVVAPQIFSHALRINPLLVIFALLFGDAVYGLVGALIALPLAAVLRETILYLRRHVVLEAWNASRTRSPG
ncbi:MAG TPA: AI-2E family transporter [Solirubrobacteraceae bacterium]|jgi:predicted PurR-regulated permease PerM|nr:AI-2E family transporter [Solirubrobacteraceae bacterium]